jgi:hypothetical protein
VFLIILAQTRSNIIVHLFIENLHPWAGSYMNIFFKKIY